MTDGITFDKESYTPGETITATVIMEGRHKEDVVTFTTPVGDLTATTSITATGTITDSLDKTWAAVSDDGVTAIYTATA